MTNFHLLKQSEKKPGELDIWSAVLPFAFDLICGILLILIGILMATGILNDVLQSLA